MNFAEGAIRLLQMLQHKDQHGRVELPIGERQIIGQASGAAGTGAYIPVCGGNVMPAI